jgi:hypothetical protein
MFNAIVGAGAVGAGAGAALRYGSGSATLPQTNGKTYNAGLTFFRYSGWLAFFGKNENYRFRFCSKIFFRFFENNLTKIVIY